MKLARLHRLKRCVGMAGQRSLQPLHERVTPDLSIAYQKDFLNWLLRKNHTFDVQCPEPSGLEILRVKKSVQTYQKLLLGNALPNSFVSEYSG